MVQARGYSYLVDEQPFFMPVLMQAGCCSKSRGPCTYDQHAHLRIRD